MFTSRKHRPFQAGSPDGAGKKFPIAEIRSAGNRREVLTIRWYLASVESGSGPLQAQENGVFRTTVTIDGAGRCAAAIELDFGMIDEDGWVYVNGWKAGESHDWQVFAGL